MSCSIADWSGAADVCLTNKRWPRETPFSRRLLIDLLLINSKTVWFMGKRTCGDSHLAWSRVLWMRGADPWGCRRLRFSEDIQEFVMHRRADTSHHGSGCFLPKTMDPNNTSKLCASAVAGVCSSGVEQEHGKGSWRKGSDGARQKKMKRHR